MTRVRSSREPRSTSSPAGRERPRRARARLELGEVAAPPQVAPARGRVGAQRGRRKVVRVHEHVHQRVQEHAVPGCARARTVRTVRCQAVDSRWLPETRGSAPRAGHPAAQQGRHVRMQAHARSAAALQRRACQPACTACRALHLASGAWRRMLAHTHGPCKRGRRAGAGRRGAPSPPGAACAMAHQMQEMDTWW